MHSYCPSLWASLHHIVLPSACMWVLVLLPVKLPSPHCTHATNLLYVLCGYTVHPQVVEHGSEVRAVPVDEIAPPVVRTEPELRQPRVGMPRQRAQEGRKQVPTNVEMHHGGLGAEEVIKNRFTD